VLAILSMFPTHSIYINGQLTTTIPQSAAQTFVSEGDGYQLMPSQIQ
jgi:hypothetical protein